MPETLETISFGFIDLDEFSEINNEYGHAFGDDVLDRIVEFGQDFAEPDWDFDREYGQGDEFLMTLPGEDKDTALEKMERFLNELRELQPEGQSVTASIGVATLPDDGTNKDDVVEKSDLAMLNVEKWGGDDVIAYGEEEPTKVVEVWFEEAMLIERDDLIRINKWIDDGSSIRALQIYNETKGIPNESSTSNTMMVTEKHNGRIEGIVKEVKSWDSSRVTFEMRGKEEQLEEEGF